MSVRQVHRQQLHTHLQDRTTKTLNSVNRSMGTTGHEALKVAMAKIVHAGKDLMRQEQSMPQRLLHLALPIDVNLREDVCPDMVYLGFSRRTQYSSLQLDANAFATQQHRANPGYRVWEGIGATAA